MRVCAREEIVLALLQCRTRWCISEVSVPGSALSQSSQVNVGASCAQGGQVNEVELGQPRQDEFTSPRTRGDVFAFRQARLDVRSTSASLAVSNCRRLREVDVVPVAEGPLLSGENALARYLLVKLFDAVADAINRLSTRRSRYTSTWEK